MKAQHTPGPWHISNLETAEQVFYLKNESMSSIGSVWNVAGHGEANARLIACAPEMLDMLQTIMPKLSQLQDESAFKLPDKVEQLIAKATSK